MPNDQEQLNTLNEVIDEAEATGTTIGTPENPVIVDLAETNTTETPITDAKAQKAAAAAEAKAAKIEAARLAKEAKEAAKAEKIEAARLAKAQKEEEKAAAISAKQTEAPALKMKQPEQNGITKPRDNSDCGKIWALANKLSSEKGGLVSKKELSASAEAVSFHPTTIGVQYYKWKTFHGITEKAVDAPVAPVAQVETQTEATA